MFEIAGGVIIGGIVLFILLAILANAAEKY